jgi:biopolymer transport protein ExbD
VKLELSKKKISSTVLISMTDVVFLLIIFLLIASNFSSQNGLPVKLPGSKTASRHSLQNISITYFSDDRVYYNNEAISFEQLDERLRKDYQSPDQVVRLSAEENLPLQKLINLMDTIRSSGFEKIFVATEVEGQ